MSELSSCEFGLWELAVLAVLREHAMHPYEIQRVLKQRHKDEVLVLKRGSLYHAIRRLAAAGLIAEGETTRDGLRPERTTYAITPDGERVLTEWLKAIVAVPRREPSTFMGSLSFLVYLAPAEAVAGLEQRVTRLRQEIEGFDARLAEATKRVGRIHLIESEYARAMLAAEMAWVGGLLDELRAGRLTWDIDTILRALHAMHVAATKTK